jgi:hypothetical protein
VGAAQGILFLVLVCVLTPGKPALGADLKELDVILPEYDILVPFLKFKQ